MEKNSMNNLIKKAVKGDEKAFEQLCRMKSKDILYRTTKLLGNIQDGEDASQTVMLYMYKNIGKLKDVEAFEAWLYRIILNTCNSSWRTQYRHKDETVWEESMNIFKDDAEINPEFYVENKELREEIMGLVDTLSYEQRVCVLMFYYEQMSCEEIGDILGITISAVSNRLYKARFKLKEKIEAARHKQGQIKLHGINTLTVLSILPQLFAKDASQVATPEIAERVLANMANKIQTLSGGMDNVVSGNGNQSRMLTKTGMSAGAKAALGVTIAVGLTTGGYLLGNYLLDRPGEVPTAMEETVQTHEFPLDEAVPTSKPTPMPTQEPVQTKQPIITVQDMIGEAQTGKLNSYRDSVISQDEAAEFAMFLQDLGMISDIVLTKDEGTYSLYYLDKEDKRLMIIQKEGAQGTQIAYRFTERSEELPYGPQVFFAFDEWQGA